MLKEKNSIYKSNKGMRNVQVQYKKNLLNSINHDLNE